MTQIISLDMTLLNFIYDNLRCAFLDMFMPLVTLFGESGIFYILLALGLLIFKKTRKTGLMLAVSLIIGLVVCNLTLKPVIARARPYTVRTDVVMLVEALSDFSFPSGHAVAAFEGATVMLCNYRKTGILFLVLAILIAFSRLYLYVHYPTDVIVGVVIGVISGLVSVKAVNILSNKIYKNKGEIKR